MTSLSKLFAIGLLILFINVEAKTIVNDITNINAIEVDKVIAPHTIDEIKNAVKAYKGPISIGGGRYSMGGQTATDKALQIDMRQFNKIINLDIAGKKITVQSGITWRDIQEEIDKHNLAIKIMQSYSSFTVGGSLSVNAHGRYVGAGPLINSAASIKIVLADGQEVNASRDINKEIFFGAIGGYGGIGIITEVTLDLVSNEKIRREAKLISVNDYKDYFFKNIRDDKKIVLHKGDLYPPDYKNVNLETWYQTEKPVTVEARLIPKNQKYWVDPTVISSIATVPYGARIRSNILEPLFHRKEIVVWRNYEASYDVAQLEPTTPRLLYTYVLQEYFVPVEKFDEFIPKLRNVFRKYNVNVINISIRHSPADHESYLAWAKEEVFSFVVYYRQATTNAAKKEVAIWTRELIDQVLLVNGRYYLPYQIHATEDQFRKAYPDSQRFFDLKRKLDPTYKFRNKLWDHYYKEN